MPALCMGKCLIACPLNWKSPEHLGESIVDTAVHSCFFPLYEVENGITTITYDPEAKGKRVDVSGMAGFYGKNEASHKAGA